MYYKLDNDEFEQIKKVEKLINGDYDMVGNLIPVDCLMAVIEDLLTEMNNLEEKVKELENHIENNCELKCTNPYDEYGISEKDFV